MVLDNAPHGVISLMLRPAERSQAGDSPVAHSSPLGDQRAKCKRVFAANVSVRGLKRNTSPPDFFKPFLQAARENFFADEFRKAGQAVENKSL